MVDLLLTLIQNRFEHLVSSPGNRHAWCNKHHSGDDALVKPSDSFPSVDLVNDVFDVLVLGLQKLLSLLDWILSTNFIHFALFRVEAFIKARSVVLDL